MRYYFFKTSLEDRGRGKGKENTLRALPGQTFPDGTAVDTTLNVQAPKEAGSHANGARLDYPEGTIFGSEHLELVSSGKTPYYSVYDSSKGQKGGDTIAFHPVQVPTGSIKDEHKDKNTAMMAQYAIFEAFGQQSGDEPADSQKPAPKTAVSYLPSDGKGMARGPIEGWSESYPNQVKAETNKIAIWLKAYLKELGVKTFAKTPSADAAAVKLVNEAYSCGESLDTVISRKRFQALMTKEQIKPEDMGLIAKGPLDWYLSIVCDEHRKGARCSSVPRDPGNDGEIRDLSVIVCNHFQISGDFSASATDAAVLSDMKKAVEKGWNLNDMLDPDRLEGLDVYADYVKALADGTIELPARQTAGNGASLVDTLMANPKYRCPDVKDGFYVEPAMWKLLCRNLYKKHNTLLFGPTGSGKTQLIEKLCKQTGTPYTVIQMGTITDPTEQLVGKLDLDPSTNGTKFDWAEFANAIQRPGVIILDELNRIPRNGENILFSCLDDTRRLSAAGAKSTDNRVVDVNPDCVFFATANIGGEYTGTKEVDAALMNRFFPIEVGYLPMNVESKMLSVKTGVVQQDADSIATVASSIRLAYGQNTISKPVSTRETIRCAEMVADGFDVKTSLETTFLPLYEGGATANDQSCERGVVNGIIHQQIRV